MLCVERLPLTNLYIGDSVAIIQQLPSATTNMPGTICAWPHRPHYNESFAPNMRRVSIQPEKSLTLHTTPYVTASKISSASSTIKPGVSLNLLLLEKHQPATVLSVFNVFTTPSPSGRTLCDIIQTPVTNGQEIRFVLRFLASTLVLPTSQHFCFVFISLFFKQIL